MQTRPYGAKTSAIAGAGASKSLSISREREYGFILEDLKRLLVTAGILIVVMIALLFLVDR